jgi:CRISPR-associated endoribonuclease Cas6
MRIRILLKVDEMPILYRHRIIALIKEALAKSDKDYKEFLYNGKVPKHFTFSLMFPSTTKFVNKKITIDRNFEIEDKVALVDGYISLFVSSSDYKFMIHLTSGLRKMGTFDFSYGDHMLVDGEYIKLEVKSISVLNERTIRNDFAIFKTMSPIALESKDDDKPVTFLDGRFETELNETMDRILKSIRQFGLKRRLRFENIKMSTKIIKHTLKDFREKTGKSIMYITGNTGIFKLTGDPDDLNTIYKIGIGNRTGQGFGMLEVVK